MRSAAAIAYSALQAVTSIPPVPLAARRLAAPELAELTPQWQSVGHCDGIGAWIDLAACTESQGLWTEAWEILSLLSERLEDAIARDETDSSQREFRRAAVAFLCARRGRIARMSSRLDIAMSFQQDAMRRARSIRHPAVLRDVLPHAWLGLSVSVVELGNYPRATRLARRTLHPDVPTSHQVHALIMLALCARKTGRLTLALRYLWRAHDLNTSPQLHADVLASLGEVAYSAGAWLPSVRARLTLLAYPVQARVATPAFAGLLEITAAQRHDRTACEQLERTIRASRWGKQWLARGDGTPSLIDAMVDLGNAVIANDSVNGALFVREKITPHDLVVLRIALARLLLADGRRPQAAAQLREASALADQAHFHERTFQIDQLRDQAERESEPPAAASAPVAFARRTSAAWERFASLPIDDGTDLVNVAITQ